MGLRALDVALAIWAAVWVWTGVQVGQEVRDLGRLSQTVGQVGTAVEQSGAAIESLAAPLPVVGDRIEEAAAAVQEAGRSAAASAERTRESSERLAYLLGIAIGLVPSLPVLALYVPRRVAEARERRELRRSLAGGLSDGLAEVLARRAVVTLPLHRLSRITDDPGADIASGRWDLLARAELRRLGLRPPPRR